jgi:hypothetical protein
MRRLLAITVTAAFSPLLVQAQLRAAPAVRVAPSPTRMGAPLVRSVPVRPLPVPTGRPQVGGPPVREVMPGRIIPMGPPGFGRPVFRRPVFGPGHFASRHFQFSFGNLGRRCFSDPFFDPLFCQQFLFRHSFFPSFSPFFSVPVFTGFPSYSVMQEAAATTSAQQSELQSEIEQLRAEIDRLREEEDLRYQSQQERQAAPAKPAHSPEEKASPTTLVFRNGRRMEVQNYAVVGKTFWIFTEQRATKVPFSELDLEASRKVNAERGMEFPILSARP